MSISFLCMQEGHSISHWKSAPPLQNSDKTGNGVNEVYTFESIYDTIKWGYMYSSQWYEASNQHVFSLIVSLLCQSEWIRNEQFNTNHSYNKIQQDGQWKLRWYMKCMCTTLHICHLMVTFASKCHVFPNIYIYNPSPTLPYIRPKKNFYDSWSHPCILYLA